MRHGFDGAAVDPGDGGTADDGQQQAELPECVSEFVLAFDAGAYPELVETA